jgi:tRNA (mo5U34)-methyltransferase
VIDMRLKTSTARERPGVPRPGGSGETTDVEDLKRRVNSIRWYHRIDLGNGIVTPGIDNSQKKLARIRMPQKLHGKTVLDIGAWDGFFSFEAERRGAERVLATDSFVWSGESWADKRGFDLAKRQLGSRVEERTVDALDIRPQDVGTYDVVLFLGVLYHMRHPLLALERLASVTRELAIIETVVDMISVRRPAIAFYGGDELARDHTNWCAPNPAALLAMLRAVGFRRVEFVAGTRSLPFRAAKAAVYRYRHGHQFWSGVRADRVAVHAWK